MTAFLVVALLVVVFLAVLITVAVVVKPIGWYIAAVLAKFDFIFTNVPESYFKEVVRFGGHKKTLLSKKGYKINNDGGENDGDIVPLEPGEDPETSLPGGLRVLGWPFIDTVYKREMKFLKSSSDGEVKPYDVPNIYNFLARVHYPYALLFVKCEDKNNLPLLGHATLLAYVLNPVKSLFATANFYDTMIGLVLPSVRECLRGFTFDEINKVKDDLDDIIWKALKEPNPDESGDVSVIDKLRNEYGVVIVALRIINIDPPEEFRGITLTRWRAEREADAAEAVATAEARKAAGPIGLAMEKWVEYEKEEGETVTQAKARLRKSGEYEKHKKLLADQINRSRGTVQERKVDISSGGEAIEGGSIASIAGTIAAAFIGAAAGKNIKDKNSPGGGKVVQDSSDDEEDEYEKEDEAAGVAFEKRYGFRAPWDPRGTST